MNYLAPIVTELVLLLGCVSVPPKDADPVAIAVPATLIFTVTVTTIVCPPLSVGSVQLSDCVPVSEHEPWLADTEVKVMFVLEVLLVNDTLEAVVLLVAFLTCQVMVSLAGAVGPPF